jgi:hypothetical protein
MFCCILYIFNSIFDHQTLDPESLEMLDPDPNSMNPDPQHWFLGFRAGNTSKTENGALKRQNSY